MKQAFLFINVDDFGTSMTEKYALLRYEVMMPKQSGLPDGTSMNRANHILLGWAETRNTNVIDPATNEDAYAQIIYMPGSSYPIRG